MNKYLGLAIIVVVCLAFVVASQEEEEEEEEEDEGWTTPTVVKGLLIHIQNVALNCSLTMFEERYPPVYPDGRGSSQQLVVGCVPTAGEDDLNNPGYLWQIQDSQTEVYYDYDPDSVEVLRNGSRFSLKHWKQKRKLSSQNVAAPTNARNYEVSGLIKKRKHNKQDVSSQVISN